ncbi:PREDICTED: flavin reductase (NADPH)-like [Branchiostoma belcheri]|uniref:Flavin reductase (NADPH)-like n=1 Tax=Branchiostoma belcheri TaxID=7741 RepID=A0A6P4ZCW2_BRABE|nr:PREDICTED: flavin reductase (NADPH)-like [Branchiostoma belcheri]XP_019631749.1 PREDICTED: flavin reductase (NADPH)-like [Branchiostoma belcheri]
MKLAVFGASGSTGVELVKQALAQGHDVTALVRDPDKMAGLVPNKDLKIEKIDLSSADTVEPHLQEKDAVLSCLGSYSWFGSVTLYTDSMGVIVTAMRKNNIKRLVCITSWYTTDTPLDPAPFLIRWIINPFFLGRVLTNMAQMEEYLQGCEDIDFTAVRPPMLTTGPVTDMEFNTAEGQQVHDRDGMRGMRHADVARFMLSILSSEEWMRKCVAVIAVPKK